MRYEYTQIENKKVTAEDLARELQAVLPSLLSGYCSMEKTISTLNERIKKLEIKRKKR